MIALLDTSVHVDLLRGARDLGEVLQAAGHRTIRLSPVVASELLRGVSGRGARSVLRLVRGLVSVEPPSWRRCWIDAGRLLPRLFSDHEAIGLARLQNDLLIALTARHTGALVVTSDAHFAALRRQVAFALQILPAARQMAGPPRPGSAVRRPRRTPARG